MLKRACVARIPPPNPGYSLLGFRATPQPPFKGGLLFARASFPSPLLRFYVFLALPFFRKKIENRAGELAAMRQERAALFGRLRLD